MASSTINVLLSSFPGLGLPSTLCIPVAASSTISDLYELVAARLPPSLDHRLILTTSSNKEVPVSSAAPITSLLSLSDHGAILPLRLSAPLCGGKGGFGSQLRAAGGRMSSKRKRTQGENNGSSRNLDGRRLRTVTEAKALAEYLALKPEMERKEKEQRRQRLEQVVEVAGRREEEIRNANGAGAHARVDGKWADAKEEAENKTRDAVVAAMKKGALLGGLQKIDVDTDAEELGSEKQVSEVLAGEMSAVKSQAESPSPKATNLKKVKERKIYGWDDEDDMSDSEIE